MLARAWRIRTAPLELPPEVAGRPAAAARARAGLRARVLPHRAGRRLPHRDGVAVVGGGFLEPGPATVWMRMRQPLVAGEEPSPLQRTLVAADVGNGISAVLDWRRFLFINVDLTVHLERMPEGEWVCVDAVTLPARRAGSAPPSRSSPTSAAGSAAPSRRLLLAER